MEAKRWNGPYYRATYQFRGRFRGVLCNILIVSIFSWQIEDNSARQTLSMLDLQGARFSDPLQPLESSVWARFRWVLFVFHVASAHFMPFPRGFGAAPRFELPEPMAESVLLWSQSLKPNSVGGSRLSHTLSVAFKVALYKGF